jgi:hypothetical protein
MVNQKETKLPPKGEKKAVEFLLDSLEVVRIGGNLVGMHLVEMGAAQLRGTRCISAPG